MLRMQCSAEDNVIIKKLSCLSWNFLYSSQGSSLCNTCIPKIPLDSLKPIFKFHLVCELLSWFTKEATINLFQQFISF